MTRLKLTRSEIAFFSINLCCLSLFLLMIPCASAQDPKTKKVDAPKAKVTPVAPKGGEQLLVNASSAKGDVDFEHDFPAGTWMLDGKKLYAALPAKAEKSQIFTVRLIYFEEKAKEKIVITIAGSNDPIIVGPVVTPPVPGADPLIQIRKDLTAIAATVAKIDARVVALEHKPVPHTAIVAHVTFVGAESDAKALATNNSTILRKWLADHDIKVHVYTSNDANIEASNLTAALMKAGGVPAIIAQDASGSIVAQGRLSTEDATKTLLTPFLKGK